MALVWRTKNDYKTGEGRGSCRGDVVVKERQESNCGGVVEEYGRQIKLWGCQERGRTTMKWRW